MAVRGQAAESNSEPSTWHHFPGRSVSYMVAGWLFSSKIFSLFLPLVVFGSIGDKNLNLPNSRDQFSSIQPLSRVQLFVTPWIAARQASLTITNSRSLLKLVSIESVMQSNNLILCRHLLLLPSIFPSIRVFSNESTLCIRWPKYWSFSFIISPSNEHPGLISFRMDWLDLLAVQRTLKSLF